MGINRLKLELEASKNTELVFLAGVHGRGGDPPYKIEAEDLKNVVNTGAHFNERSSVEIFKGRYFVAGCIYQVIDRIIFRTQRTPEGLHIPELPPF